MDRLPAKILGLAVLLLAAPSLLAGSLERLGSVSLEPRLFLQRPAFDEQPARGLSWSAAFSAELRYEWDGGRNRLAFEPYLRLDQHDSGRNRADLREASWLHVRGPWALRVGLSRVFWGVTESRHLVDIVNQTDLVEDIDDEAKLGQPMIHLERWSEYGTFGLFVLPGFRERTFPAEDARLRGPLPIDSHRARYESRAQDRRVDLALRWSLPTGPWDLGLSAFRGNSREPRLVPTLLNQARLALVPHYDVITQLGVDVQHTQGAWLWKLESIFRHGHGDRFAAAVGGLEYTVFGLRGGPADLGLLLEVLYDGRDVERSPPTLYGDDLFVGLRLALNDPDSTSLLAGVLAEQGGDGMIALVEAERRLGDAWTLALEARWLGDIDRTHPFLQGLRKDSFLTLRLKRHF